MKRKVSRREMKLRKVLAANIRRGLEDSPMTAGQLAEKASMSRAYVFHLLNAESGASVDVLARLGHALGTPPAELLRTK